MVQNSLYSKLPKIILHYFWHQIVMYTTSPVTHSNNKIMIIICYRDLNWREWNFIQFSMSFDGGPHCILLNRNGWLSFRLFFLKVHKYLHSEVCLPSIVQVKYNREEVECKETLHLYDPILKNRRYIFNLRITALNGISCS